MFFGFNAPIFINFGFKTPFYSLYFKFFSKIFAVENNF